MTPLEGIQKAAKEFNIPIKDANPNCKSCYGRGYTSINTTTGEPVPCKCIMPDMNETTKRAVEMSARPPRNRKEKRLQAKYAKRNLTKVNLG